MVKHVLAIASIATAAACGGGGGNTGPIDEATATSLCQQGCDREAECDPTTDVEMCVSDCVDNVVGTFREDVFEAFVECETQLECGGNTDQCIEDSCSPTSTHETYEARCREKLLECDFGQDEIDQSCETDPASGSGTSGGDAGLLCVIAPSIIADLTACFDEDCQSLQTCYSAVLEEHGIDF